MRANKGRPGANRAANEEIPVVQVEDTSKFISSEASKESDIERAFDAPADGGTSIEDVEELDWMDGLARTDTNVIIHSQANFDLIFANDPVLKHLGVSTMGDRMSWSALPPWRGDDPDQQIGFTDADQAMVTRRLRGYWNGVLKALPKSRAEEMTVAWAVLPQQRFSPWRDFIDHLPAWDGVKRLETAIPPECVTPTPYTQRTFANFFLAFLALAQRAYEPGCQADSMLVLAGGQGLRKTSFFRAIVPRSWMCAEPASIPDTDDKDLLEEAHLAAVVLFDEIDKLRRRDEQAALKAFITKRHDTWRPSYGRNSSPHARTFVCGATTNVDEFLLDFTGNRRYWPVVVEAQIPAEFLTREYMDLLLAEARDRYFAGERYDYSPEFEELATEVRARHIHDPIGDVVRGWIAVGEELRIAPPGETENEKALRLSLAMSYPLEALSVRFLIDTAEELNHIDPSKDKASAEKIAAALDSHPSYQRGSGSKTINHKKAKVWWERIV